MLQELFSVTLQELFSLFRPDLRWGYFDWEEKIQLIHCGIWNQAFLKTLPVKEIILKARVNIFQAWTITSQFFSRAKENFYLR